MPEREIPHKRFATQVRLNLPGHNGSIGVFNPSDALNERRFASLEKNIDHLRKIGWRVDLGQSVYLKDIKFDEESISCRADDISNFLSRSEIRLLLAAWGGKGANHLIGRVPYDLARSAAKPILGFSDTTVLLNDLTDRTNLVTFLGPNVAGKLHETSFGDLRQFRSDFDWVGFSPIPAAEFHAVCDGSATGKLFGGNLKCFCLGLLLANVRMDTLRRGIFFVEDTNTSPSEIEQILVSLRHSGFLSGLKGIVFSPSSNSERPEEVQKSMTVNDILARIGSDLGIPIVTTDVVGHGTRKNPAIPIGADVVISTDQKLFSVNSDVSHRS
ncbi:MULTISPECIES: LD-carboxypeptidase [unclassified Ruegeria]|uniref:LD-carboxypeptidase n=1 Tax=unclassified Ruegeria TaxID=2625375 RepID=UPI001487E172|nr:MULTISPECIES: LD-carboxypeptidase [unclassified Ruegeria]NOD85914.1 hypothetical protein [Ruegeria sp. HKCCD6119]